MNAPAFDHVNGQWKDERQTDDQMQDTRPYAPGFRRNVVDGQAGNGKHSKQRDQGYAGNDAALPAQTGSHVQRNQCTDHQQRKKRAERVRCCNQNARATG